MRNRQKEETEQVQSTSNLLHSMLLDITKRIKGEKPPSNVSDHAMLEMATTRFEEQLRHPVRNFIWGELPRLTQIQIQRKLLDIEASKCELHHEMLMDTKKTFATLNSLPIIVISFWVLKISSAGVKQIQQSKGRSAQVQRRLLIKELEERISELPNFPLLNRHGHYMNGMVLYTLDRLYRAVERHAKATGEWPWVRNDITYLGDPYLTTPEKLIVTRRLKKMYSCLSRAH